MNWFTDKLYDLAASPRGGEGAWGELAAQDAMSPAVRASYWAGSEMPKDPRIAAWRSAPRMGDTVAPPSDTAWMLPPQGPPTWEAAHRFGASGLTPPPARSEADAYRMGSLAGMDEYRKAPATAWRDIDRAAIEEQYGGTDIHGIKLPPVSADEPGAWRDAIIGETPADALVNWGLGGTGKLAKGALALGGLFKLADPAEAGVISKAGGLLRGKPGGPWEGGIRAYHSSPHDFDKFDWSKLRTGEGANMYGSGFYFAENPAVSGQGGQYWHQFTNRFGGPEHTAATYLGTLGHDREKAIETLRGSIAKDVEIIRTERFPNGRKLYEGEIEGLTGVVAQRREALRLLESDAPIGPRTYEVNIAARPELMLDWDKPLKLQNPAVQEFWERQFPKRERDPTGKQIYENAVTSAYEPGTLVSAAPKVSEALREAGIPGIRYLDQGSRSAVDFHTLKEGDKFFAANYDKAKQSPAFDTREDAQRWINAEKARLQTYNYVVTDPSRLDILAKYGIVGGAPVGMGALAAQDQYGEPRQ